MIRHELRERALDLVDQARRATKLHDGWFWAGIMNDQADVLEQLVDYLDDTTVGNQ